MFAVLAMVDEKWHCESVFEVVDEMRETEQVLGRAEIFTSTPLIRNEHT